MKKDEVPQDESSLAAVNMRELCYATDEEGNYTTALSAGWEPKAIALSNALEDIKERTALALQQLKENKVSPIAYFMEFNKMDVAVLSGYTGIWQWRIKRHLKPAVFMGLSNNTLKKYADAFLLTTDELKNFTGN